MNQPEAQRTRKDAATFILAVVALIGVCFFSLLQKMESVALVSIAILVIVLYRSSVIEVSKALGKALEGIGRRTTKLSISQVSIELAALTTPPSLWTDKNLPESAFLTEGDVSSTGIMSLFDKLDKAETLDYLIIDIKDGAYWFASRVFIFTYFLQVMRGLRCVVVVESKGESYRRLIGLATPHDVQTKIAAKDTWLEQALSNAIAQPNVANKVINSSLASSDAGTIIRNFIEDVQMRTQIDPNLPDEWKPLKSPASPIPSTWEHTRYLNLDTINDYGLRSAFYEWDSSHYQALLDKDMSTEILLRRKAPFIAIVNSKGEFQELLEREKLMDQVDK